ncbi:uncharacterized protein LOC116614730 [Nematostella vectensis]|uniref:uncharacterized protein LOC116614730 n=1 Tax=Nematostella vectensis TaxID=45351 RepID=UPI0020770D56|nr:uncharacterized protein LOC116614730 [Nematostella vectensis]
MEDRVIDFFKSKGLHHLLNGLENSGFTSMQDIIYMETEDNEHVISDAEDRKTLAIALYEDDRVVSALLESLGLSQFLEGLFAAGFSSLEALLGLTEHALETAGMALSGHRKRVMRLVQALRQRSVGQACGIGGWDSHPQLQQGRFGKFLCLTASVLPPDHNQTVQVKFMVDSGSDVTTLRHDVIERLGLPRIGTARQAGPGGLFIDSPVYRACVSIGDKMVGLEVVQDHVDSLGTTVLYQFDHLIRGQSHIWLEKK